MDDLKPMGPPTTVISAEHALNIANSFDTIIDVRSPAEFIDDHIPGSINLPVLNDQQRADIGGIYKKISPFTAKRTGAALVAQNIAIHLQTILKNKARNWRPLIYCWRGGQRSNAMAQIFSNIGWHCSVVDGGYKAYRRHVLNRLDTIASEVFLIILAGQTGTAKTHILQEVKKKGAQIVDLEQLACHRGSLLGSNPDIVQPTQRLFESKIFSTLTNLDLQKKIFIEAESNKIGNVHVPDGLWSAMRSAASIRVVAPMAARVNFLKRDYAHMIKNSELIMPLLLKLKHRQNASQLATWQRLIKKKDWDQLIESLLIHHYPSLDHFLSLKYGEHYSLTPDLQRLLFQIAH